MSQCIGAGCTQPGCSGKNADAIRAAGQSMHRRVVIDGGKLDFVPNRKDRRRKARRRRR